uniref:HTH_48 domain-containing protein n=1 Tax=Panagrellus redivivus TaxID=6233 RepID=A0A7E5A061_PANRE
MVQIMHIRVYYKSINKVSGKKGRKNHRSSLSVYTIAHSEQVAMHRGLALEQLAMMGTFYRNFKGRFVTDVQPKTVQTESEEHGNIIEKRTLMLIIRSVKRTF